MHTIRRTIFILTALALLRRKLRQWAATQPATVAPRDTASTNGSTNGNWARIR